MEYQIEQELGFEQDEGDETDDTSQYADIQPINQWEPPDYFLG
jgi:hypothetical protein